MLDLSTENDRNHMSLSDILVQNETDCLLDLAVRRDLSAVQDFVAVGIATFARSQYLVYDYTIPGNEKIGFGG